MKYIITESQYNKAIGRFITYQFDPHEEKTSKDYPDSIFWVKNGKVVAEIEKPNFWITFDTWEIISQMFSLDYDETQSVIKEWLEKHHKLGGLTPQRPRWPVAYRSWKFIK